jgi:hypothetical protein
VEFNKVERIGEAHEIRGKPLTDEEVKYFEELHVVGPIQGHFQM